MMKSGVVIVGSFRFCNVFGRVLDCSMMLVF